MNEKFDELARSMAQSVTRRSALKKFGVGLAGMALACFGLVDRAEAKGKPNPKPNHKTCQNCITLCRAWGASYWQCYQHCVSMGLCR